MCDLAQGTCAGGMPLCGVMFNQRRHLLVVFCSIALGATAVAQYDITD